MKMKYILIAIFMSLVFAGNIHALTFEAVSKDIQIHGFISQGYMDSQDNNYLANNSSDGTFAFNEIGINFSTKLYKNLRIGLQLFSHDLGAIGNNEVTLDWAFADYRMKEWLGLRVGKIKAPHGLYNETRDMDMLRTSVFLPSSVYNELSRATMSGITGLGVYGDVPAGPVGDFSYYLLAGTADVEGDESNGAVRQFNSSPIWKVSGDFDFENMSIAAVEWQLPVSDLSFADSLRLKWTYRMSELTIPAEITPIGAATMPFPAGTAVDYEIESFASYVYSLEYVWDNLTVAAEYMKTRSEWSIDVPAFGMSIMKDSRSKTHGYYLSAAYRFNEWFEAGTYYSKYYADSDDKNGSEGVRSGQYMYDYNAWQNDFALSLRFDINEYWIAKIEGHLMDGAALCLRMDNDDYEEDWWMVAAKLTFSF